MNNTMPQLNPRYEAIFNPDIIDQDSNRIASSYVYYYNRKYGRDGHLFKERFKSEPVRSALPLATAGTQERHGVLYYTVTLYSPKPSESWCCGESKGL